MESKAHALAAGLFLLLLGTALVAAVAWFRGDHVQRIAITVVARGGVPGLAVKAPVKLRGVDVGSVESIGFDPADPRRILVHLAVDSAAPLTRGTQAQLGYQGVTGLSYVDLSDRGDDPRPLSELTDGERLLELKPSLLDQLASSGPALLGALTETTARLNALLSPQNQQRLERLLDRSDEAMAGVAHRADELKPAVAALAPALRRLEAAASGAEPALQRIDAAAAQTAQLAADLRGRVQMIDRFGDAARRVEAAVRAVELGLVGDDVLARPPLAETISQATRGIDRAASQWSDQPQSLLFGRSSPPPGPGEAGFVAPAGAR